MSMLFWRAYLHLLRFDFYLARGDFAALYDRVRSQSLRACASTAPDVERICAAVDMACIWYWKDVRCLQRSAVAVCLLRNSGVHAELVVGARQLPFRAHAWVEVDGRVINDKSYMREIYGVLERC